MASWMVHLRIADNLVDKISNISITDFIIGNIAPDSGIPSEDGKTFIPNADISHYRTTSNKDFVEIHVNEYINQYFTLEKRSNYSNQEKSFYLGYLVHLLTDILWTEKIIRPTIDKFYTLYINDKNKWLSNFKQDWYDQDFRFINLNPNFRAFSIYTNICEYRNSFIDIFAQDAFDNKRKIITDFYHTKMDNLDRDYMYLKEEEMNMFVDESTNKIDKILRDGISLMTQFKYE